MGIFGKFERSSVIDAMTVLILGYDLYLLYTGLGYQQSELFGVPSDPEVLAVQLTGFLILVYAGEFLYDKARSGGSDEYSVR